MLPNGEVRPLSKDDHRLRLRVVDIKLAAEPGAHYFAEVVYYSISLAAWLAEHGLTERFVVVAASAVWPGSYETSRDPFGARALPPRRAGSNTGRASAGVGGRHRSGSLRRVRTRAWPASSARSSPACSRRPGLSCPGTSTLSATGASSSATPWLDKNGDLTNDPRHCWPTAEREDHLSRVVGLSRGSAKLLAVAAADVGDAGRS